MDLCYFICFEGKGVHLSLVFAVAKLICSINHPCEQNQGLSPENRGMAEVSLILLVKYARHRAQRFGQADAPTMSSSVAVGLLVRLTQALMY